MRNASFSSLSTNLCCCLFPLSLALASSPVSSPQLLRPPQPLSFQLACQTRALVQMGLHWSPFMTRHSLPPCPYPRRIAQVSCHASLAPPQLSRGPLCEWLRVVRIARIHQPCAVAGQRDWSRRALASVITQPVRSTSSLFRLPFILYDSLSPFLSCHRFF
jgi:hypothetical protein